MVFLRDDRPNLNKLRQAMILAAGEGTRLKPLTLDTPKVLLPLAGEPLLKHLLGWLTHYGCCEVAINLHHLPEKIQSYLGDGASFGLTQLLYSVENTLLGTAGGVRNVHNFFTSTFLVVYGDVIPVFNLDGMYRFHQERRALVTLVLTETTKPWESGIVEIDGTGKVTSFIEKPSRGSGHGNLGNGGVYILEKEALSYIPDNRYCDFGYDVFPRMLKLGLPVFGYKLPAGENTVDIGDSDRYHQAEVNIALGKISFRIT